MRWWRTCLVGLGAAVLVGAGCSGGSPGDAGPDTTTTRAPTTTTTSAPPATTSAVPSTTIAAIGADLVVRNAVVHTMAAGEPVTASSIAILGDRIVAVGGDELVVSPDAAVLDAAGRTVLPGRVDAHSHWYEYGSRDGLGPDEIARTILEQGITTTAELHVGPDLLAQLEAWEAAGELVVRTSAYLVHTDVCGAEQGDWWREHPPTREPGELLRVGGVKVFADGGACNVAAVSFAYADGTSGDLYRDVDALASVIADVDAAGHQVAVHALGDRAVRTALDAYERVLAGGGNPLRHRIDHNAVVHPDDRARYRQVGSLPSSSAAGPRARCSTGPASSTVRHRSTPTGSGHGAR